MKVLCPVDDSDFSRLFVEGVGIIFRSKVAETVVLHVLPAGSYGSRQVRKKNISASSPSLSEKMNQAGKKLLHGHAERLKVARRQAGTSPLVSLETMVMKGHVSDGQKIFAGKTRNVILKRRKM